ncbi:efflux RND transporter periplasmic adaptor subunit [Candidatus Pacebacteria bacterium]|nr:efflux RND transporter periplasmic adaptor subunit [Candidatus Paceibacterota bacterium]
MKTLLAVFKDIFIYFKPTSRGGIIRLALVLAVLAGAAAYANFSNSEPDTTTESALRTVAVAPVGSLSADSVFTILGTVSAVSEADIKPEVSGRITSVPVRLGQSVRAGAVIATIENSAEAAAVLQAEGSYDAAVAATTQSSVSLEQAELAIDSARQSMLSTYRSAVSTYRSIVETGLTEVYGEKTINGYPLRVFGGGRQADYLKSEREILESTSNQLQQSSNSISIDSNLEAAVLELQGELLNLRAFLQILIEQIEITDPTVRFTQVQIDTSRITFLGNIGTLNSLITQLDTTVTNLQTSEQTLADAEGNTTEESAVTDAQIKQALGSLRAAQAAYAKTIVRSPITGVVNELDVKLGDFVGAQAKIARVANNNALEVTAYVGDRDRERLEAGTEVLIDGRVEGTVTTVAPAIDTETRKYEVKIGAQTDDLQNGETVTVRIQNDSVPQSDTDATLLIPITAVKFTDTNGIVFTVADNTLVAHQVEVGAVRGGSIEITTGLDTDMIIVTDARGLNAGEEVEALSN